MPSHSRKARDPAKSDFKKGGAHKHKGDGMVDNSVMVDAVGKRSGRELPPELRQQMEQSYGFDFGSVRVHEDSEAEQLGALALARGNELHFKPGQYAPDTEKGKTLIGHELAHVVQQGGQAAPSKPMRRGDVNISRGLDAEADVAGARAARGDVAEVTGTADAGELQLYTEKPEWEQGEKDWDAGIDLRVADDGQMAVGQEGGYGTHSLFAKAKQVNEVNAILEKNKSVIRLSAGSTKVEGESPDGSGMQVLSGIEAENVSTKSKGDDMKLWADCGRSFRDVVGVGEGTGKNYNDTAAVYNWRTGDKRTHVSRWEQIKITLGLKDDPRKEVNEERETNQSNPTKMKNEIFDALFKYGKAYYDACSEGEKDLFDKELGINQYADPEVGEGYTMSSGGENYEGQRTWNFHWAGVVMKSGADHVTLENYATGNAEEQNDDWEFQMYGPPSKEGQTFHEQHLASKQHGDAPTTMRVRKRK